MGVGGVGGGVRTLVYSKGKISTEKSPSRRIEPKLLHDFDQIFVSWVFFPIK